MASLTKAQRAWLLFHDGEYRVIRHAWLDGRKRQVVGPPETWMYLRAWKRPGFYYETCTIHRDERAGLDGLYDPTLWLITPASRQALKEPTNTTEETK